MKNKIKIRANASIANISCGFDCLGLSIKEPYDEVSLEFNESKKLLITVSGIKSELIPVNPEKNTAGKAVLSFLNSIGENKGLNIHIEKGIPPGSGIGSSASSAAAAVVGINELFNKPYKLEQLIFHGMAGEEVASGSFHADNIAPAILGGIRLIRSYEPLEILNLPIPKKLICVVVLPNFSINTYDARNMLPKRVPLKSAVEQAGNLAGFTIALYQENYELMKRSMVDLFAEPVRGKLIPGYEKIQYHLKDEEIIGCGISGSGPAIFALTNNMDASKKIKAIIIDEFKKIGIDSIGYISNVQNSPPKIV